MLDIKADFNHRLNQIIDKRLEHQRTLESLRTYLGASRLGVPCRRALQYEYTHTPKDEGKEFTGRFLRIFEIGHALEEMAREWLRQIGFCIVTHKNGQPLGFATADARIKGHVDGIILETPPDLTFACPALWECKTMNSKSWKETASKGLITSKREYAVQIALYQAYMEETTPGISENPALFTAVNKDTAELYHELVLFNRELAQEGSDKGVEILKDTDSGQLCSRITKDPTSFSCRFCPWFNTCWKEESSCTF